MKIGSLMVVKTTVRAQWRMRKRPGGPEAGLLQGCWEMSEKRIMGGAKSVFRAKETIGGVKWMM